MALCSRNFSPGRLPVAARLGHQLMEGRWLHDQNYLDDYARYWLREPGTGRQSCTNTAVGWRTRLYQRYLVTGDRAVCHFAARLIWPRDYRQWEQERLTTNGLFWQYDVRDAMEESISGSRTNKNLRPSINSYMFGNARAIAAIARLAGNEKWPANLTPRPRS